MNTFRQAGVYAGRIPKGGKQRGSRHNRMLDLNCHKQPTRQNLNDPGSRPSLNRPVTM
jgi:hypothetical protein